MQEVRQGDQWHLAEHSEESPNFCRVARYAHEPFVEDGGNEEDNEHGDVFADPRVHAGHETVADEPRVDRHVPVSPVLVKSGSIPPSAVKLSVPKVGELRKNVEPKVEEAVEHQEPTSKGRN